MYTLKKILLLDRDGTLIKEPEDFQIDSLDKFELMPGVINGLRRLVDYGFELHIITNQDGLGTPAYPVASYLKVQNFLETLLASEGISFKTVQVCPHLEKDQCGCRKPAIGLVADILVNCHTNRRVVVAGDRESDRKLAENIGAEFFRVSSNDNWEMISSEIIKNGRKLCSNRKTKETDIELELYPDNPETISVSTGIGFFDHMLTSMFVHWGTGVRLSAVGDLHVDTHHLIEDCAIVIGEVLRKVYGNGRGINRFGFVLPMDEALSTVALDLSGRSWFVLSGSSLSMPDTPVPGDMISHFFRSMAHSGAFTLNMNVRGDNFHHMTESLFKGLGRTLNQALAMERARYTVPSTKGAL